MRMEAGVAAGHPATAEAGAAVLAPVMTLDRGAELYAPGGLLLDTGDVLHQPQLERTLSLLADEGARSVYDGSIASALLELEAERGGAVTRDDLSSYDARWSDPA